MELRADLAQREVHLGCEHEDRDPGDQADVSVDQPQADPDGHEGDGQRGQQLEHHPREERDPEGAHRRTPVGVAELPHAGDRSALAAEGTQRREAGEEVEDLRTEPLHDAQPARGPTFRESPDEHHEQGDQRERPGDDQSRHPVLREHDDQRRRRHRHCEDELGQVADEVGLERVQPAGCERDDSRPVALGEPAWAERCRLRDHLLAELGDRLRGRPVRVALLGPGHDGAGKHDDAEPHDERADVRDVGAPADRTPAEHGAVVHRSGERMREQQGLGHHERGSCGAQCGGQGDVAPGRPGVPQEPRVKRLHATERLTRSCARTSGRCAPGCSSR
ncbi:hypothetical protein GALL_408920 [mine drainage metagenome]|uniref:Uncharacterized protein n=1 Tax=mine drainage metagenome TaxID=410659 RepID=A0A1J5Q121_9ZZZZ